MAQRKLINLTQAQDNLDKAKNKVVLDDPFLAVITLGAEWERQDIPTTATDGDKYCWGPSYFEGDPSYNHMFAVIHEACHNIRKDCLWITLKPNKKIANLAADHCIHDMLDDMGYRIPGEAFYNKTWKGLSRDEVYRRLEQQQNQSQSQPGKPNCELREPDPAKVGEIEEKLETLLRTAIAVAEAQGKLPGFLKREFSNEKRFFLDYKKAIKILLSTSLSKQDYSLKRPSRRGVALDLYLPSMRGQGTGTVVLVGDTSGSISNEQLGQCIEQVNQACLQLKPSRLILIWCDAEIGGVQEFTSFPVPIQKMKPVGGGGTDFNPPFDWIKKNKVKPDCLIYITDGHGTFPDKKPSYPLLWVVTEGGNTNVPFGKLAILGER